MSHRNLLLAPGVFLGDEVTQSGDPPKHADDLIATIQREGMRWCALQISPGNEGAAAMRITKEPRRRISSFSSPTALSSLSPRSELEHTSSASRSVL